MQKSKTRNKTEQTKPTKQTKVQMHIKQKKNILSMQQVPSMQWWNTFSLPPGSKLRSSLAIPLLPKHYILHKSIIEVHGINPYLLPDNPSYNLKSWIKKNISMCKYTDKLWSGQACPSHTSKLPHLRRRSIYINAIGFCKPRFFCVFPSCLHTVVKLQAN